MSDFERTFGAGANIDSIIDGFSYASNSSSFDASEIIFYDYSDALDFVGEDSGLVLEVASETFEEYCVFNADFDQGPPKTIVTRDVYKASRLRKDEYIRVTTSIERKYSCKAIPKVFALSLPYDSDQAAWMNCHLDSRILHIIENNEVTLESIEDYFREGGSSMQTALTRRPRDLGEIEILLKSKDMELIPISETASLIISREESVDAIVTDGNCTYLVQYGFSYEIYDMLV